MSNIIVSYMRLTDSLATQILVARPAYRPVYLKFAQYAQPSPRRPVLAQMSARNINAKAGDIAKAGKDYYEFLIKFAKEIGLAVPAEATTTEATTTEASTTEASTKDASTSEASTT